MIFLIQLRCKNDRKSKNKDALTNTSETRKKSKVHPYAIPAVYQKWVGVITLYIHNLLSIFSVSWGKEGQYYYASNQTHMI